MMAAVAAGAAWAGAHAQGEQAARGIPAIDPPDHVLWGTDWPHPNVKIMPNDGEIVDLIPLCAPDPAIQQKLLVENPACLFRFTEG